MGGAQKKTSKTDFEGWRLWAVGLMAMAMLVPVTMPVAVLRGLVHDRFAVSEFQTSLFMSVNMIGAVLSAPLVGALGDRLRSRRRLVVWATLCDAALFWAMTLPSSFGVFMALRFVEGAAHILALSSLLAVLADSPGRRGRLMGMAGAGITFGIAIGAPLGGALGRSDPLIPLYAGGGLLVLLAVAAAAVLPERPPRAHRASLRELWRLISLDKALAAPLTFAFIDRFTTGFFTTTFSLYMRRVFELSPPEIGMLIACFMLPFSLLSYPVGRLADRFSRTALMCGGSLVYGLGTLTLGWWSADGLPFLMAMLGTTAAVMFVPSLIMTTDLSQPETKATAMGGFNAAGALGFLVGPAVGGWVSQSVALGQGWQAGYQAAFVVAGASEVLCVLIALPVLLRLRRAGRTT
jgi:predicted MFS family arabinose efflux permease